ncbi:MAG: TetR/AcrR family transcriptional regulator [Burkholderiales bacterium]|nr:TetR/AcrR family transcriptional regulator [Burkholderiales bacterium]MDE2290154.1 TetR/AcrR family transcriptional regulator [Burkholderiales bacterium]MDE2610694.1 TetR/AcrR family transcriptional regulator [Burkholderiales bacterium]
MTQSSSPKRRAPGTARGRPREFDASAVSEAAAEVFWEHGYHAASLDTLCEATGLLRGSLYGAFGDKHGMLLAALDRYAEGALAQLAERLNEQIPPREALRNALLHHTRVVSTLTGLRGCFITNAAMEMQPGDETVAARITSVMRRISTLLAAAVIRGQAAGVFDSTLDEDAVGEFLLCVTQGLRVLGKVGHDEARLTAVVDVALRALE